MNESFNSSFLNDSPWCVTDTKVGLLCIVGRLGGVMAKSIESEVLVSRLPADWHDEVIVFIEYQLEQAEQDENKLALKYFQSCLLALEMLSRLGVRIPKTEDQ
jgi:hypothetical protein